MEENLIYNIRSDCYRIKPRQGYNIMPGAYCNPKTIEDAGKHIKVTYTYGISSDLTKKGPYEVTQLIDKENS